MILPTSRMGARVWPLVDFLSTHFSMTCENRGRMQTPTVAERELAYVKYVQAFLTRGEVFGHLMKHPFRLITVLVILGEKDQTSSKSLIIRITNPIFLQSVFLCFFYELLMNFRRIGETYPRFIWTRSILPYLTFCGMDDIF